MTTSRKNFKLEKNYEFISAVYVSGLTSIEDIYKFLTHFDYDLIEKIQKACEISLYEKDKR